jgi:hypothetical protein
MGEGGLGEGGFCAGGAADLRVERPELVYFGVGGGTAALGFRSSRVPVGDSVNRGDGGTAPRERALESREVAIVLAIGVGRAVDGVVPCFAGLPEREESVDSDGLLPDPCLARFRPD